MISALMLSLFASSGELDCYGYGPCANGVPKPESPLGYGRGALFLFVWAVASNDHGLLCMRAKDYSAWDSSEPVACGHVSSRFRAFRSSSM